MNGRAATPAGSKEAALIRLMSDVALGGDRKVADSTTKALAVMAKSINDALDAMRIELRVLNRRLELLEARRGNARKDVIRDERGQIVGVYETEED